MKFSIKDFFSKCDQICSFLRIWSHLLNKSLMENFIFCALMNKMQLEFYFFQISDSRQKVETSGTLLHILRDKSHKSQGGEILMTPAGKHVSLIDLKSKVPADRFAIWILICIWYRHPSAVRLTAFYFLHFGNALEMENNTDVEKLSDSAPLESDFEGKSEEFETVNNLDRCQSNEDWLRYAGRLAFAVQKAETLIYSLKKRDKIVRSQFLWNVSSASSAISNICVEITEITEINETSLKRYKAQYQSRSSHWRCFVKKSVLRDFAKFTGKHQCQCLFFDFIKKETMGKVFSCEFREIYKNTFFLQITSERLLLTGVIAGIKYWPQTITSWPWPW